ncbi:MAG: desulfoferrodoxin [Candidatus Hadarchaeales archaeon]
MSLTQLRQVYRCNVCGNIVMVMHAGGGQLVCCGQPMQLMEEKTADVGKEKHVPVIEMGGGRILVKVGSVPHPMEEKHYIEWIELVVDGVSHIKFLRPGDRPEAEFSVTGKDVSAREYCNIHGLWRA